MCSSATDTESGTHKNSSTHVTTHDLMSSAWEQQRLQEEQGRKENKELFGL